MSAERRDDEVVPVMRYTLAGLRGLQFVRRSLETPPPEGTLCFVDDGTREGFKRGQTIAQFKGGRWTNGRGKALSFAPTYWTEIEGVKA